MHWRHLRLVRAWSAAGLLSTLSAFGAAPALAAEPSDPLPTAEARAESVKILDAKKAGDLAVELRGRGQSAVSMTIKNTSSRRLNVVLPPGLVASGAVGQGLQNMGLGAPGNRAGTFGQFTPPAGNGGVGLPPSVSRPRPGSLPSRSPRGSRSRSRCRPSA